MQRDPQEKDQTLLKFTVVIRRLHGQLQVSNQHLSLHSHPKHQASKEGYMPKAYNREILPCRSA